MGGGKANTVLDIGNQDSTVCSSGNSNRTKSTAYSQLTDGPTRVC